MTTLWATELAQLIPFSRFRSPQNHTNTIPYSLGKGVMFGDKHITITRRNIVLAFSWILPYFFMAYLARRPNTYRKRLFLLPVVVASIIGNTSLYRVEDPREGWFDWVRGLLAMTVVAHSIYFAVVPHGVLTVKEHDLGTPPGHDARSPIILPSCVFDALEVGLIARGIGWQYGRGSHLPEARRPLDRIGYLKSTILSIISVYLVIDLIDSCLELLPGITSTSGSLFIPQLPPVPRYLISTILHIGASFLVILGISMWYDVASLVGVGILHQSPSQWPPCHDKPWCMGSLHELWSKRWHQLLRHAFLVYGGYPGYWLAGDVGMLFGTFIASGVFHECGFYLGGASIDPKVVLFFSIQPFGILAEKRFKRYTGRRVEGWLGSLWASLFVVVLGQICTNSWVERGAAGKVLVPPVVSPARRLLLPWIRSLMT